MATWVTHLIIADAVLKQFPGLERRGFCVGNIAPDCNVENADWTAFTPSRAVTHWMQGERKNAADCDVFYKEYIAKRRGQIRFGVDPQLAEFISDPDKLIYLHAEEGKPGAAVPGDSHPAAAAGQRVDPGGRILVRNAGGRPACRWHALHQCRTE